MARSRMRNKKKVNVRPQRPGKQISTQEPVTGKSLLLYLAFICGCSLLAAQIFIYRQTFISFYVPFSILIVSGLVATPLLRNFLNIYLLTKSLFLQAFHNAISIGGTLVFLFMAGNYYITEGIATNVSLTITEVGELGKSRRTSCRLPYAVVNYHGNEKDLIFKCGTEVKFYKYVDVTVKRGLFGFEIIIEKNLRN